MHQERIMVIFFLLKWYALVIRKQTNKHKETFVNLQSIGIIVIKNKEKGWSPTPAVVLVGI